jgi:hypothetical protein
MKANALVAAMLCEFLALGASPARADFKYSDTAKITGGSLKGMMKTVGIFSKEAAQAMKPVTTTHSIKGDRLRTDNSDGRIQIIDLAGRRIIDIDPQKRSYTEITFEEMKAAMQKMQDQMQQKMDKQPKSKDATANVNAKITVTPGTGSRQIQGLTANEMKVLIEMEIQAQAQDSGQTSAQPSGPVSGTISTSIDSWVAPAVPGYQEVGEFYQRMAKEINWVPPSNIRVDPRVSQSMDELQKNQSAFKGLPLLQYVSMSMAGQQGAAGSATDANSSGSTANSSSSNSDTPTSVSGAMVKGLGGLFGKKKNKDEAPADQNSQNPPSPSTPSSLIEMTIEVTSFSNAALDSSSFEIPAGFTRVQQDPDQILKQGKP